MKLPNGEHASISPSKLANYLLSETHSAGHSKAKFLRALGFDKTTVNALRDELLRIAREDDVTDTVGSPHGTKFVVDSLLSTLSGQHVLIRTIWIIDIGHQNPRLVTAYPP
jgi:hypothetical protein